jgi:type I restriction enzyme, S subunit
MSEVKLPRGWRILRLGEVCTKPQYGWTSKATQSGKVRYIRTTDLTKGKIDWDKVPYCELEPENINKYQVEKDDILISRAGSVGFSFRIEEVPLNTIFASYLIRFKPSQANPKYIEYFLKSPMYWKSISEVSAGIAVQNINASKLSDLEIPIAPIPEQKRIVARLDAVFGHLDLFREKLDRIPVLLKNFRQQVLTQAVTGELKDEIYDLKPLGDFGIKIQTGPFGSALHKHEYIVGGVPVINPSHIKNGEILPNLEVSISLEKLKELERWKLKDGDVIIGRRGEMGRAARYVESQTMICGTGSLVFKRSPDLNPDFLSIYLRSPFTIQFLETNSVGSTMINLNQKIIKSLPFPNVSLAEQTEIVDHVERLFFISERIEIQYQSLKAKIDQLPQAILAKAFRGELVGQEVKEYVREVGELGMVAEKLELNRSK